jgi:hypothetical protein
MTRRLPYCYLVPSVSSLKLWMCIPLDRFCRWVIWKWCSWVAWAQELSWVCTWGVSLGCCSLYKAWGWLNDVLWRCLICIPGHFFSGSLKKATWTSP